MTTTRCHAILAVCGALIAAAGLSVAPAEASPLNHAVAAIQSSGGRYVWGEASLHAADCSGLVSVAQTLAMGLPPHRLGSTHTLLSGQWPHAEPGANPGDLFVIGANEHHMVAQVDGVNIEARRAGQPFRVGPEAASPFDPKFTHRYHINAAILRGA